MPGMGDCATWGACHNHPHDPRTPEGDDDMSFETPVSQLNVLSSRLEAVDELLNDAVELLEVLLECDSRPKSFDDCIRNMIKRMTYI
jgi:hypothetical protein